MGILDKNGPHTQLYPDILFLQIKTVYFLVLSMKIYIIINWGKNVIKTKKIVIWRPKIALFSGESVDLKRLKVCEILPEIIFLRKYLLLKFEIPF